MKEEVFKTILNGESIVFEIDTDFNGGYLYLETIPQIMSGDGETAKQGEELTIKLTTLF